MEEIELPGFRFHPTDEELVSFYLHKRLAEGAPKTFQYLITDLDIYKCDPWDLPRMATLCKGQREWYFFCPRDRKYKNSNRPNRVTKSGFWKATGTDKTIVAKRCIGLKKSLVFYSGKASKGEKTDWMMHEFRLPSPPEKTHEDLCWAICKIFKRKTSTSQWNMPNLQTYGIAGGSWPVGPSFDKSMPTLEFPTDHDLHHDNYHGSFAQNEEDEKSENSSVTSTPRACTAISLFSSSDHFQSSHPSSDELKSQKSSLTSTPRLGTPVSTFSNHDHVQSSNLQFDDESLIESVLKTSESIKDLKPNFRDMKPSKLKLNKSSNKGTTCTDENFWSPFLSPLMDMKSLDYHKTFVQPSTFGDESMPVCQQEQLALLTPENFACFLWSPLSISLWDQQVISHESPAPYAISS